MNARSIRYLALCLFQAMLFAAPFAARAEKPGTPVVLVASASMEDPYYREAVILAVPLAEGHIGLILNRPTQTSVAKLFPDEEASQRIQANVHIGGPDYPNAVFALVRGAHEGDEAELREVTSQLAIALDATAVNRVIAENGDARYFMGLVSWAPGELAEELRGGAWQTFSPEAELVMSADVERLWKRLAARTSERTAGRGVSRPPLS